jgi:hypothetical protein
MQLSLICEFHKPALDYKERITKFDVVPPRIITNLKCVRAVFCVCWGGAGGGCGHMEYSHVDEYHKIMTICEMDLQF